MNSLTRFTILGALLFSTASFAHDCRAIFEPGFSKEAQALVGKKFDLVDEDAARDARRAPFRISVREDVDSDPETLTLKVTFSGRTVIEDKSLSIGFYENVARTAEWLKNLPMCEDLYPSRFGR